MIKFFELRRFPLTRALLLRGSLTNVIGGRRKSLFLGGPTRIGKTEWARSLGRHVYWNGTIDASMWDDEARYVIFDDFEWKFMPFKKQFIGCQLEFAITDKYCRKRTIKRWGKPAIIIYNDDNNPFLEMSAYFERWCSENSIRIEITECLF